jgi:Carboxypeptidase regulatory-like domain
MREARMTRTTAALIAVLMFNPVSSSAQTTFSVPAPPGQPPTPQGANANAPTPGTSVLRGHVFAADSGQPLRKAQVRIFAGEIRENRLATTDVDGFYEFKEVRAGRYTINASKGSYVGLSYGQQRPTDPAKPITILDNQMVEKMDFMLPRGSVVSGRILDEFGEPISEVQVSVQQYQTVQGQRRLVPTGRQGFTNDIGEFRLFGVSPGQYYLVATWRAANPGSSDDGTAYAPMYFPGTDNPAQAQRIALAIGEEKSDIVMSLRPIRATRVSGTVTASDGKPMTGSVMVISTSGFGFNVAASGQIRPDGTFSVNGVAPGEYTLRAQAFGGGRETEIATAKITATGDDINDLQLIAAKPSTATGRILMDPAAGSTLPQGLMIFPMPIEPGAMPMGMPPTRISDDGSFELKAAPGKTRINMGGSPGWTVRSIRLNGTDITDTGLEFRPNEDISGIEIEITNKVTTITGLVTNSRGETVKDYAAIAFAQDREKWKINGRYQAIGRPDQDGRFKMGGLTPSDYYIIALDKVDPSQINDPDFLDSIRARATAITIREGESRTVDLKLSTAQ